MSTTLVSLQEYLDTDYSPDREYVDGVIVERHVGKRRHSRVQANIAYHLQRRYPGFFVWPEQRLRVNASRVRIPDICVTLEDPGIDTFVAPPFLCVEILSPEDETSNLLEKLEEYAVLGVAHLWVVDPRRLKAYTYSSRKLEEVAGVTIEAGDLFLPLSEVFERL